MTYINNIWVHKARNPLVFAHHSSVFVVSAVTVAPTPGPAEFNALLTPATQHVVQPDFPCTDRRKSVQLQKTLNKSCSLSKSQIHMPLVLKRQ